MDIFQIIASPELATVPDVALGLWLRALAFCSQHGVDTIERSTIVRMSGSNKHVTRTLETLRAHGLFEAVGRHKATSRQATGKHKATSGQVQGKADSHDWYRPVISGHPWILWKSLGTEPATCAPDPDLSAGSVSDLTPGSAPNKSINPPPVIFEGRVREGNDPALAEPCNGSEPLDAPEEANRPSPPPKSKAARKGPKRASNEAPSEGAPSTEPESSAPTDPEVFTLTPDEPKQPKGGKKTAHRMPVGWAPKASHFKLGEERGLPPAELEKQREAFKDFHDSKGSLFVDWDAAFRTWIRNAGIYGPKGRSPYPGVQRPAPPGERTWRMPEAQ